MDVSTPSPVMPILFFHIDYVLALKQSSKQATYIETKQQTSKTVQCRHVLFGRRIESTIQRRFELRERPIVVWILDYELLFQTCNLFLTTQELITADARCEYIVPNLACSQKHVT